MRTPTTRPSGTRRRRRAHPGTTGCSARCCGRSPTAWPRTCSARRSPSRAAEAGGRRSPTCWPRAAATRSARCVLSSEDLDRAHEEDRAALEQVLGEERVTLVLTATAPIHRWCSGWQTLVKHGLAQYPRRRRPARRRVRRPARRPARRAGRADPGVEARGAARAELAAGARPGRRPGRRAGAARRRQRRGHAGAQRVPRDRHRGRAAHQPRRPRAGDRPGGARPPGAAARRRLRLPGRTRARGAVRRPRRGPGGRGRRGSLAGRPRLRCSTRTACSRRGPTRRCRSGTARSAAGRPWCPSSSGAEDRETQLWRARQERGAYRKGLLRLGR